MPSDTPADAEGGGAPLSGLKVLDFSVQLPGPLATLMLAEAGATVVKVERPLTGDIARLSSHPGENVEFALLNRGKRSVVLDLKTPHGIAMAKRLAREADVLIEQFRPGVMARLGLGYEHLRELNRRLIYCSISGYGQTGSLSARAGHDLNYVARAGLLGISIGTDGKPSLPATQIADIGGGSFPAVLNILLALRQRDATGRGCFLDVAMGDNVFTWMRRALGSALQGQAGHEPGCHPSSGGLARYNVYAAKDGKYLAVAAIEEAFWQKLCDLVRLPTSLRDDAAQSEAAKQALSEIFRTRTAAEWMSAFEGEDVCVELVRSVSETITDPHWVERGIFAGQLQLNDGRMIPSLPVPIDRIFKQTTVSIAPPLGSSDPDAPDIWLPAPPRR